MTRSELEAKVAAAKAKKAARKPVVTLTVEQLAGIALDYITDEDHPDFIRVVALIDFLEDTYEIHDNNVFQQDATLWAQDIVTQKMNLSANFKEASYAIAQTLSHRFTYTER